VPAAHNILTFSSEESNHKRFIQTGLDATKFKSKAGMQFQHLKYNTHVGFNGKEVVSKKRRSTLMLRELREKHVGTRCPEAESSAKTSEFASSSSSIITSTNPPWVLVLVPNASTSQSH
jgi:hypothetical protein